MIELKNLVQRLLRASDEENITLEEVDTSIQHVTQKQEDLNESGSELSAGLVDEGLQNLFDHPLKEAREMFEKAYLEQKLIAVGGSVGKVAQLAGVERTHLYRKMKALGIGAKKIVKKSK